MANSREAQFQWGVTEAMTAHGCKADTVGDYDLTPVSEVDSGKPLEPEKQRLAEVIDRLNDLYVAEVSDDDKLHFANGVADRIERNEAVMAQVHNYSEDQVMHDLFPKKVIGAVFDDFSDHEQLRIPLLKDETTGRHFRGVDFQSVG